MKHITILIIALIALTGCSGGGGSSSSDGKVTSTITPSALTVAAGDDLILTVVTTNTTDKDVTIRFECAYSRNGGIKLNFPSRTVTIIANGNATFTYTPLNNAAPGTMLIEFATVSGSDTSPTVETTVEFLATVMGAS